MGYEVGASVCYGIRISDWVEKEESLKSAFGDFDIPDPLRSIFDKNKLSLERSWGDYSEEGAYIYCAGWGTGTYINARDYGSDFTGIKPPKASKIQKMDNRGVK